jgi:23S rRNA pseudouridine1911/1915/1917 synthase
MRLGDRLAAMFPGASRRTIKQWLERGRVRVNGDVARRADADVRPGDRVDLGRPADAPFPSALRLVHADDEIVVIDKPAGLLTIATERERERTAYRLVRRWAAASAADARRGQPVFIVHRLDRDTSGLVVFARTPGAKRRLQEQFARRAVERVYVALVEGRVASERGTLRDRLENGPSLPVRRARGGRGVDAITRYRVIERRAASTLLELSIETGRRGQIRAQLAALGHPIVGDTRYGSRRDPLRRVCLHATRLGFVHPSGERVRFESRAPASFARA